ncbi:MAG: ABC transporter substrate-binding protein [Streptomycetales bacterium]
MRTPTTRVALISLVLPMLALAGCGGGASGGGGGGQLRLGMQYDLGTLDPQVLTSVGDKQLSENIFEGLVQYEPGGTEIEAALATDWESSGDGTSWTFTLREGVQFHDGFGEMTARDVAFTFERLVSAELASPNAELMQSLDKVEAHGDDEVEFKLGEPDPAFLDKLANWYAGIVSAKAVQQKGKKFAQDPIGTGPYQFESWRPQQETVLGPFDNYWGDKPGLQRVVYVPIPDATTMYNAFEAGDVDIIQITDPDKLAQYQQQGDIKFSSKPGLITRFFGLKADEPPFDDPRVREAVAYAIDRKKMIDNLFGETSTPADSVLAPDVTHVARGVVKYQHNPQRAKQLLAEAGYPDGVSVTFSVPNIDRFTEPATVIQQDLKAVGINVKIKVMEAQSFLEALVTDEGLQMFILSRSQEPAPDRVMYTWHHSSQIPANNWARIDDPAIDRALAKATTSMDEGLRERLFADVQRKVFEGHHYYYIDHENFVFAMRDRVRGFQSDPLRSIRLDGVSVEG